MMQNFHVGPHFWEKNFELKTFQNSHEGQNFEISKKILKNEDLHENSESRDLLGILSTTFLSKIRKLAQKMLEKIDFFWKFSLFEEKRC